MIFIKYKPYNYGTKNMKTNESLRWYTPQLVEVIGLPLTMMVKYEIHQLEIHEYTCSQDENIEYKFKSYFQL